MSPATLIKFSKHPAIVWFDRIAPIIALVIAAYYGLHKEWLQASIWGATAVLAVVLSVCSITKLMEKMLIKLIARR